jgi:ATP-dependent Clp protease protease subunit
LLAKHTGQPLERIARDFDRDLFMTAEQAVVYGIVDKILDKDDECLDNQ